VSLQANTMEIIMSLAHTVSRDKRFLYHVIELKTVVNELRKTQAKYSLTNVIFLLTTFQLKRLSAE